MSMGKKNSKHIQSIKTENTNGVGLSIHYEKQQKVLPYHSRLGKRKAGKNSRGKDNRMDTNSARG